MSIRGLLFDFNGTLFFDSRYHIQAFNQCFDIYGVEHLDNLSIINNIFGCTNEVICKSFFKPDATDEDVAKFEELKENLYMYMCLTALETPKLCRGAEQLFDTLKERKIPFCIATGSPRENVDFYFEHLGLGRWFTYDNIVYADGTFASKPAPDCYILAAQRLGLSPTECAVFEDGTSGLTAANAAGAGRVIAVWEKELPSPLHDGLRVDEVHHDLSDWQGILARMDLI